MVFGLTVSTVGWVSAILAIIFGIVVIIWKKSLNYLVGLWLIIWGILQIISLY